MNSRRPTIALAAVFALATCPAIAATTAAAAAAAAKFNAQVIALVKATPKLKIDKTVPPSAGFDTKTQPYVNVLGVPEGQAVGGYLESDGAHHGMLTNGYIVLAVPLESGGSGGVFTQIVFARQKGYAKYVYAGYVSSAGHLSVQIKNGTIVATLPYYAERDPNCCPSKMIVQTYAVQGGALHKLSDKTVPTPKPR
ncbi:MAG TPA: hypothetical protein VGK84_02155 [Candidatus Tumulicola sp.]|jgi:hypothetical protein